MSDELIVEARELSNTKKWPCSAKGARASEDYLSLSEAGSVRGRTFPWQPRLPTCHWTADQHSWSNGRANDTRAIVQFGTLTFY